MESFSSSSLYSGPLSQSAQKVLAALRAQSLLPAARNHYGHSRQIERYNGHQRETSSQGSWNRTREERTDRVPERPWSRPQCYSSSSYWDSFSQRERPQLTSTYSQSSQPYAPAYSQTPSQAPDVSQAPAPSTPRDRFSLSVHTPQMLTQDSPWSTSDETIEPTFTLNFSPENSEPDGLFFPRTENPVPHIEEPAWAFDETPAGPQMNLVPDIHTPDQHRENGYAMIGGGDCLSPQHEFEEPFPSENWGKPNLAQNPTKEAFSGGEGDGLQRGSGSGIKWQLGSLLLRHRGDLTQDDAHSDKQAYEPMRMQENDNGAGTRSDRRKELKARKELNNVNKDQSFTFSGGTWSEKDKGNADLELDDYTEVVGSTNWIKEELAIDLNKESGGAKERFPISVTDQMDTTLDCDTQDSNFRPTARQSKRGDGLGLQETHGKGASQDQCLHTGTKMAEEPTARVEAKKTQDVTHRTAPRTSPYQAAEPRPAEETATEPRENHAVVNPSVQVEPLENPSADNPAAQRDPTEWTLLFSDTATIEDHRPTREEVTREGRAKGGVEVEEKRSLPKEEVKEGEEEPMETDPGRSGLESETSGSGGLLVLRMSQERGGRGLGFRPPLLCQTPPSKTSHCHRDNHQAVNKGSRRGGSDEDRTPAKPSGSGHDFPPKLALAVTPTRLAGGLEDGEHLPRSHPHQPAAPPKPPLLTPPFAFKRKHETGPSQNDPPPSKGDSFPRRPIKWEPPRSSQGAQGRAGGTEGRGPLTSIPKPTDCTLAFTPDPRSKIKRTLQHTERAKEGWANGANQLPPDPDWQEIPSKELGLHSSIEGSSSETHRPNRTSKPSKPKRAKPAPGQDPTGPDTEPNSTSRGDGQFKVASLTTSITSDPRVKDAGKCSPEERCAVLEEAGRARALVVTMVFQDGSTQLDPEQKLSPSVCGLLVLMKGALDQSGPDDSLGTQDSLLYLRLEHTPAWAQQEAHTSQHLFTREVLLQMVSGSQLVVCYKAKDLLRTALQHYRQELSWKQVAACRIQDPQVSGWLLDPSDPASCYHDLLAKHCRRPLGNPAMALGSRKVSQVISSLCLLYRLNLELGSKLRSQGLWELYSTMELSMIPVLAAMESHRIHVDKEALKRTSEMLGTKMKQLEQEAHQAAGQMFLVSSSTQLRTVLFEKLRLHERCENKKLPKTVNKQQQSTSEATLLQLQDLHPLPKIIIEYRQVHKIKSTFVDGVLSCMMSKSYISSTWHQTSAVTGRISAKHPNFQALPRQPVQITKKQYIQGKEAEVVTVHPRAMFVSQNGWTFLAADFCQVELRLLAHLSCDPELLKIFNDPRADVFTMLASQWKGLSKAEVTSEQREHAKRIVYSVVYGAGRERLSGILGVSAEQASQFQDSFLQTYKEVQAFIHRTIQQCHKRGYVVSIMGRRRSLPLIHSSDWGVRMQAERQAVNFVVQGSAADICKMAMIRIFSQVTSSSSLSARLVAQLHDELLYEVEDSQVENFAVLVKTTMESLQHLDCLGVHLKVPLKVAVSSGKSWGSMSERHVGTDSGPASV